jgi:hypothetical protein
MVTGSQPILAIERRAVGCACESSQVRNGKGRRWKGTHMGIMGVSVFGFSLLTGLVSHPRRQTWACRVVLRSRPSNVGTWKPTFSFPVSRMAPVCYINQMCLFPRCAPKLAQDQRGNITAIKHQQRRFRGCESLFTVHPPTLNKVVH